LSLSKFKQIKKAIFRILLIVLFKIVIVYIFVVKLLLKQIVLIANNSNTRLLDKTSRSLLITTIVILKVSFYILEAIC